MPTLYSNKYWVATHARYNLIEPDLPIKILKILVSETCRAVTATPVFLPHMHHIELNSNKINTLNYLPDQACLNEAFNNLHRE